MARNSVLLYSYLGVLREIKREDEPSCHPELVLNEVKDLRLS